ncbi:hypothetical protein YC2023_037711 [Brassica napus]
MMETKESQEFEDFTIWGFRVFGVMEEKSIVEVFFFLRGFTFFGQVRVILP